MELVEGFVFGICTRMYVPDFIRFYVVSVLLLVSFNNRDEEIILIKRETSFIPIDKCSCNQILIENYVISSNKQILQSQNK